MTKKLIRTVVAGALAVAAAGLLGAAADPGWDASPKTVAVETDPGWDLAAAPADPGWNASSQTASSVLDPGWS